MKFMLILNSDETTEASAAQNEDDLNAMGKFNEQLIKAGVILAGEGLHPSSAGARVVFDGEARSVVDGPFAESKELIAGFWILDVSSKDEAIEWTKRVPITSGRIEVRQVFDIADFPQDNEYVQQEKAWREEHEESRTA